MASRRGYLSQEELAEMADITITDPTEADDQISQAEEIIDKYVGFQDKAMSYEITGLVASGGATSFTLEQIHQNNMQLDYLKGCWIEIIGGTGAGQRRKITGQTYEGVVTVESAFSPALDTTSYYRIWQLGKFPRSQDLVFDGIHTPQRYYKSIPEEVRRAVSAQVAYIIEMGQDFFNSDKSELESESIGDYSYTKRGGQPGAPGPGRLIAPRAKLLLRGFVIRMGGY
jgi:hypothetical protein